MRTMLHQILVLAIALLILPQLGNAQTCTSSGSGAWIASATWGGTDPATCVNFVISVGHTVQINAGDNVMVDNSGGSSGSITINGILDISGNLIPPPPLGPAVLSLMNTSVIIVGVGNITGNATGSIVNGINVYFGEDLLGIGLQLFSAIVAAGGLTADGMLPIELLSFYAATQTNSIALHWQTANELDNDYMAVERSRDGKHFDELGRLNGNGTSFEVQTYSFFDEKPFPGLNYYRLRQVDFDGTTSYHRVIAVVFGETKEELLVFPTIAKEQVFIHWSTPLKEQTIVQLVDLSGNVLLRQALKAGTQSTSIKVDQLLSGHYFLQIQSGDEIQLERFIKN